MIRDGAPHDIAVDELVADDLVDLRAGDQLVADGVVRDSAGLEADESLLTGESEPVDKQAGDRLLSGSFVAASGPIVRSALSRRLTRPADLRVSRPAAVGRAGRQPEWLPVSKQARTNIRN